MGFEYISGGCFFSGVGGGGRVRVFSGLIGRAGFLLFFFLLGLKRLV